MILVKKTSLGHLTGCNIIVYAKNGFGKIRNYNYTFLSSLDNEMLKVVETLPYIHLTQWMVGDYRHTTEIAMAFTSLTVSTSSFEGLNHPRGYIMHSKHWAQSCPLVVNSSDQFSGIFLTWVYILPSDQGSMWESDIPLHWFHFQSQRKHYSFAL